MFPQIDGPELKCPSKAVFYASSKLPCIANRKRRALKQLFKMQHIDLKMSLVTMFSQSLQYLAGF